MSPEATKQAALSEITSTLLVRKSKSAPVGVISKVLRILQVLHTSPAGLQLRSIVEQTKINKSTVYRFLSHLEAEGYLFRDDSGAYMPGPMLVRLGSGTNYQMTLRKIGRPVLQELRDVTGETVNLGILNGRDICYVDVVQSRNSFDRVSRIGSVRPLYCTAMGKMLTAVMPANDRERMLSSLRLERITPHTISELAKLRCELATIEKKGFALDNEEASLGARCISAPIFIDSNRLVAALSVAGPMSRMGMDRIPFLVDNLQNAARVISTRLNHGAGPH